VTEPLIVVSLDGSELSEGALPYAVALAKATASRLLLITVWEGAEEALTQTFPTLAEDVFKRGEEHFESYLKDAAAKVQAAGVQADAEVLIGEAAEKLLELLQQRRPQMLALATHGRSGLGRWVYGSVAGKLVREAEVPVLAVGPRALERAAPAAIKRILVPLDGSALGERALEPARELAEALGAGLLLAQVLRWAAQAFAFGVPDIDIAQVDSQLADAAHEYLTQKAQSLTTKQKVDTVVLRGLPADALVDLVEREKIDLVVMASHTRTGIVRAVLGSVADRVLQSNAPVLLVP
jgi:nucleotide-binding universal stress UspA family protein